MKTSVSLVIASAVLLDVVLVSGMHLESGLGKKFGKKLCASMGERASHSQLLEAPGNRTSCVVSVTKEVLYTTAVGTVVPLRETSFKIENLGTFELKLTGECELDPCYKVTSSPGDNFNGNYVYNVPAMVDGKLAFIAVFDCKNGEQLTQKAEFYDASPKIVEAANKDYGYGLNLEDLKKCVEKAKQAA